MWLWLSIACEFGEVAKPAVVTAPAAAPRARPDVVVITLDTTRADRLGAYGHASARTDSIDALAAAGLRFDHAYSVVPLTIPAHATLFTGLFPFHTEVRDNGATPLHERFTTLAEVFQGAGYATAGSAAAFVTTRQWGFAQGFDAYFDEMPPRVEQAKAAQNYWHSERPGELVVGDALAWLATVPEEKPVFLWVHLYDAHLPYRPPDSYAKLQPGRPYDAELAYVDDQVGRLVDAFADRSTLFALIGDHGESLGEHDEGEHGLYTYDATQRVPWILSGAGVKPGVVAQPVSGADFMPTVLSLAGLDAPAGLDGKVQPGTPTVPYAESYQLSDRLRLAPHRMVAEGTLKLIVKPRPELYDIVADPGERTNLAELRPDDVTRLTGLLDGLGATPPTRGGSLDAATVAQLEALGYVSGATGAVDPFSLPDPLDYPQLMSGINEMERQRTKESKDTIKALKRLLKLKPDAYELRMRMSGLLMKSQRMDEAKIFLAETTRLFPDDPRPFAQLAAVTQRENPVRALELAGQALDVDPKDRTAREVSVTCQLLVGLDEDAITAGTTWFEEDPDNLGLAAVLGNYWMRRGEFARAEVYLRAASAGANPNASARIQLAAVLGGTGRAAEAVTLLEAELGDHPQSVEAWRALSRVYADERDYQSQLVAARRVVTLEPESAPARLALAQCLFNQGDFAAAGPILSEAESLAPENPDILLLQANLLEKQGQPEAGRALFLKAEALHKARTGQGEAAVPAKPAVPGGSNVVARPGGK